jgi:hypothetical protein
VNWPSVRTETSFGRETPVFQGGLAKAQSGVRQQTGRRLEPPVVTLYTGPKFTKSEVAFTGLNSGERNFNSLFISAPGTSAGARRPQGANFLEGVKKDMSVLRKRSPWVIPAASLLLGALTLGLAGCGGGGGDELPNNPTPQPISLPAGVTPTVTKATSSVPLNPGKAAHLETTSDPNQTGGITGVSLDVLPGVSQGQAIDGIGIEVVPTAQSVLTKANNNPAQSGHTPVAEFQLGEVGSDGNIITNINTSRPIVFGGAGATIKLNQQVADFAELLQMVRSGQCVLVARRFVNGALVPILGVTVTLDTDNQTITVVGDVSGDIVITCDAVHAQGGVG